MEIQEHGTRLVRFRELRRTVPLSRSTIWRKVRDGSFPKPIRMSKSAVGWLASEIQEWIAEQAASRK
ncbi:MAG: AlpA family phage regulatory protein [Acidobacteria bacterium]|nr:AlpA family phage regulatory protein [Acidobacteriota bacterium]